MSKKFTKVHVFDIDWDLEDEDSPTGRVSQHEAGLPSEFTVEVDLSYPVAQQIDKIFDNQFTWCVNGYSYEVLDDTHEDVEDNGHPKDTLSNPDKILVWLYTKPTSKGCLFAGDRIAMTNALFNGKSKTFSNALYQLSKKGYITKIDDAWYVTNEGESYYYNTLADSKVEDADESGEEDAVEDLEDDNEDERTSAEVNDYVKSAYAYAAEAFKYAAEAFKALM